METRRCCARVPAVLAAVLIAAAIASPAAAAPCGTRDAGGALACDAEPPVRAVHAAPIDPAPADAPAGRIGAARADDARAGAAAVRRLLGRLAARHAIRFCPAPLR